MFSIIVPIYNSEKYLKQCIDSILNQPYKDFELLLINDGSTDSSELILEEYSNDDRVKIYNNANMGVSATRNFGILEARNNYIVFVDSDDFLETNYLGKVFAIIKEKKVDGILFGFNTLYETAKKRKVDSEILDATRINDSNIDRILDYFYKKRMIYTVWRFIFKRDIIINKGILFEEGIVHEDELWIPQVLCHINSIFYIPEKLYNYRLRDNSITTNPSMSNYTSYLKVSIKLCELSIKEKNKSKKLFYRRCAYKNASLAYFGIREISDPKEKE